MLLHLMAFAGTWVRMPTDQLIDSSDLVVVGTIIRERPGPVRTYDEFTDYFTIGRLRVEEVLAGQVPQEGVEVLYESFANNSGSLPYHLGQRGVWILSRDPGSGCYSADYPWAFEPIHKRGRIDGALRRIRARRYGATSQGLSLFAQASRERCSPDGVALLVGLRNDIQEPIQVRLGNGLLKVNMECPDG